MLAGCTGSAVKSGSAEDGGPAAKGDSIGFEYFYRGFTPLMDEADASAFESAPEIVIIRTQEDLQVFMSTYCPGIAYFVADFSSECLIAVSDISGARPSYNVSSEIKAIKVSDNRLEVVIDEEQNISERVYALNTGVGHWYVNIVKVNSDDLPPGLEGVLVK